MLISAVIDISNSMISMINNMISINRMISNMISINRMISSGAMVFIEGTQTLNLTPPAITLTIKCCYHTKYQPTAKTLVL